MLKLFRTIGQYVTLDVPNYPHPLRVTVLAVSKEGEVELGFEVPCGVLILHDNEDFNGQENVLKTGVALDEFRVSKLFLSTGQYVTLQVPHYPSLIGLVVLGVSEGRRVQVGFEAPREVLISRDDEQVKQFENSLKAAMGLHHEQ